MSDPPMRKHGTRWCYVTGCRRKECVEAAMEYQRQRRRRAKTARLHAEGRDWCPTCNGDGTVPLAAPFTEGDR